MTAHRSALTQDAWSDGNDDGLERAAKLLEARAQNLLCRKRTNQVDRHVSAVLSRAASDIRKLKTGVKI